MGHYDTQFKQDKEAKAKERRRQFEIRIANAVINLGTDDLEKLVIAAENWDSVVSVIDMMRAIGKK